MPTDQQASGGSGPCGYRWYCSTIGSAVISHGVVIARRIMSDCSLAHAEAFLFLTDCTGVNFFGLLRIVVNSGETSVISF